MYYICFWIHAGIDKLAEEHCVGAPTMQLIVDALSRPMSYDFRSGEFVPLSLWGVYLVYYSFAESRLSWIICVPQWNPPPPPAFEKIWFYKEGVFR